MSEEKNFNIFDDIKNRVSLVSEIESRGISLIPSGRQRLRCRCPLPGHNDSTPSFTVSLNNDPELFHCFGCKKGGSIIDFVMYCGTDGNSELTRKEAVKYLIKKYKIENISYFDIDRIASIPDKYKKEELPILSKSLLISEDFRNYLKSSLNINQDFTKIEDYMKAVDEAMFSSDYPNLNVLEDLISNSLKTINNKDISKKHEYNCKKCNLCELRTYCKNSVFGFGNFNAKTFIIGDFITYEESNNNRPFSDNAGLFLVEEFLKLDVNPFDFWLTSCQLCHSAKSNIEFSKICFNENILKHIELVKPKNIITTGNIAKKMVEDINLGFIKNIINIEDYRDVFSSGGIESLKYKEIKESLSSCLTKIA